MIAFASVHGHGVYGGNPKSSPSLSYSRLPFILFSVSIRLLGGRYRIREAHVSGTTLSLGLSGLYQGLQHPPTWHIKDGGCHETTFLAMYLAPALGSAKEG
ncbi:hypothetical protein SERLADRAFT_435797 [Serpula lacrymans var. lacrymans S7.9]|uniref:Uncharacterized protein n=1 Tax=Serpula lacrymans var. lacrymans (strain S7.9) TaxID=578457 RepID=F8NNG3_SERL9|nr:uncharacterized protein SERLADRAFT_435797 [Serpula lacrymans var. lacrymans S7.9]EGO28020.1 hypothetical protein SERLADRAFT_435797 [Serpula lacrymans var. lacrymans S7.9]